MSFVINWKLRVLLCRHVYLVPSSTIQIRTRCLQIGWISISDHTQKLSFGTSFLEALSSGFNNSNAFVRFFSILRRGRENQFYSLDFFAFWESSKILSLPKLARFNDFFLRERYVEFIGGPGKYRCFWGVRLMQYNILNSILPAYI